MDVRESNGSSFDATVSKRFRRHWIVRRSTRGYLIGTHFDVTERAGRVLSIVHIRNICDRNYSSRSFLAPFHRATSIFALVRHYALVGVRRATEANEVVKKKENKTVERPTYQYTYMVQSVLWVQCVFWHTRRHLYAGPIACAWFEYWTLNPRALGHYDKIIIILDPTIIAISRSGPRRPSGI